jgi:hypothetical protein
VAEKACAFGLSDGSRCQNLNEWNHVLARYSRAGRDRYFLWLVAILLSDSLLTQLVKSWYIGRFHTWL